MKNEDLEPLHARHPGWTADGCPLRVPVTPRNGGVTMAGFACDWTGGHCLPGDQCDKWRSMHFKEQEIRDEIFG